MVLRDTCEGFLVRGWAQLMVGGGRKKKLFANLMLGQTD